MRPTILSMLILLGALAACASPTVPSPSNVQPTVAQSAPTLSGTSAERDCSITNAAPPDKFRADDPAKFAAASGKPKLVEFFAYW